MPIQESVVAPTNRSFRYGDGLFESIFMQASNLPFWKDHLTRLKQGMQLLKMPWMEYWDEEDLQKACQELAVLNKAEKKARVRLMVYRSGGGLYTPTSNVPKIWMECKPLKQHTFLLKKQGMRLGIYADIPLCYSFISPFKTNNALSYVLASIYKKEQELDECILLNQHARVADATYHNIWGVKEGKILYPAISEGGVAGVMQKVLLDLLQDMNLKVEATQLTVAQLKNCEEIWLSNAVHGLEWVSFFEGLTYRNHWAAKVSNELAERVEMITSI